MDTNQSQLSTERKGNIYFPILRQCNNNTRTQQWIKVRYLPVVRVLYLCLLLAGVYVSRGVGLRGCWREGVACGSLADWQDTRETTTTSFARFFASHLNAPWHGRVRGSFLAGNARRRPANVNDGWAGYRSPALICLWCAVMTMEKVNSVSWD